MLSPTTTAWMRKRLDRLDRVEYRRLRRCIEDSQRKVGLCRGRARDVMEILITHSCPVHPSQCASYLVERSMAR